MRSWLLDVAPVMPCKILVNADWRSTDEALGDGNSGRLTVTLPAETFWTLDWDDGNALPRCLP